jgi:hypothetical protein
VKPYEKLSLATDVILIITMLVLIWEAFTE